METQVYAWPVLLWGGRLMATITTIVCDRCHRKLLIDDNYRTNEGPIKNYQINPGPIGWNKDLCKSCVEFIIDLLKRSLTGLDGK